MLPRDFFLNFFEEFVSIRKTKSLPHANTYFWKIWDTKLGFGMETLAPLLLTQTLMPIYKKGGSNCWQKEVVPCWFYFSTRALSSSSSNSSTPLEHPRDQKKKRSISLQRSLRASTLEKPDLQSVFIWTICRDRTSYYDCEQSEGTLSYTRYLWKSAIHNLIMSFELVRLVLIDLRARSGLCID